MELTDTQLNTIKTYFYSQPIVAAYLFGSYVRNEADCKSDIDILVDLDYSQPIGLKFIQMKIDLEDILHADVDLVSSKGLSKHLQAVIDKEKR